MTRFALEFLFWFWGVLAGIVAIFAWHAAIRYRRNNGKSRTLCLYWATALLWTAVFVNRLWYSIARTDPDGLGEWMRGHFPSLAAMTLVLVFAALMHLRVFSPSFWRGYMALALVAAAVLALILGDITWSM